MNLPTAPDSQGVRLPGKPVAHGPVEKARVGRDSPDGYDPSVQAIQTIRIARTSKS